MLPTGNHIFGTGRGFQFMLPWYGLKMVIFHLKLVISICSWHSKQVIWSIFLVALVTRIGDKKYRGSSIMFCVMHSYGVNFFYLMIFVK